MPTALTRSPADTTLPGETRRQVWPAPEVASHSLLVLTATRLFLVPVESPPAAEAVAAIDTGGDPVELLGPSAIVIELATVLKVTLNLASNMLRVTYLQPGQGPMRVGVALANAETTDLIFEKLWRRLGDDMALGPYQSDFWSLVRGPLLVMGAVLAVTLALALAMNAAEDTSALRNRGLPPWFDWRVVCGVGGAALAVVQVWLHRRVTRPPTRLVLVRR